MFRSVDPLAGSQWSAPGTVAGFAQSAPNAVLMSFAEAGAEALQRRARARHRLRRRTQRAPARAPRMERGGHRPVVAHALRRREPHARASTRRPISRGSLRRWSASRRRDRSFDLVIAHGIWNLARSGGAIPTGARRGGSRRQARRGTVCVHVLAKHASAADDARRRRAVRVHRVLRRAAMLPHRSAARCRARAASASCGIPACRFTSTTCRSRVCSRPARRR